MKPDRQKSRSVAERLTQALVRHSTTLLGAVVLLTVGLTFPFVMMPPTSSASQDPGGEIFEAQRLVADRFASRAHRMVFVVEARQGDMLDRQALLELLRNSDALRLDPSVGPKLLNYPNRSSGREVTGLTTIADAVDGALRAAGGSGLEDATEAQVQAAVEGVLAQGGPDRFGLSIKTVRDRETGRWRAPALMIYVLADNDALGGGGDVVGLGTDDTSKEEFARELLTLLRGRREHLDVWGIAIDVNLTAAEQGASAGPYIGLTILAVLLLVGLTFRSYWTVAITGLALGVLIIWLRGLCNLIGLKNDLILDTIVPIAMISFGVDYVFHAVGRYREEQNAGRPLRSAFTIGLASVLGALVLAMASDAAAFLSNATTGIESLVQFGIGAALATVSAFLVLGLAVPLALLRIEELVGGDPTTCSGRIAASVGGLLAALTAMAAVVVSVFVLPWLGAALLGLYLVLMIVLPLLILRPKTDRTEAAPNASDEAHSRGFQLIGRSVVAIASKRWLVLPCLGAFTLYCVHLAHQVRADFDVRDLFDGQSSFVVGLDKLDLHMGEQGGEAASIYIEASLDRPEVLRTLRGFIERLEGLDSQRLARDSQSRLRLERGVIGVVDDVMSHPLALAAISTAEGVQISDDDNDELPDTPTQAAAIYRFARAKGIPQSRDQLLRTPDQVRTALWISDDPLESPATVLTLRLPGSRSQETTEAARAELDPLVADLQRRLRDDDEQARAVLTGQPIARQATLDAILWAFRLSIPVALLLCLFISAIFMWSLRYAVVSIIPILVVVAWLYAFMSLMGYGVNVVTATIGAISIGIGIDFAVHLTMRFREELARTGHRTEALAIAGTGTGGALAASALSSVVGFAILALAPMPMFAAYGLLTAVMIVLALVASLALLPSLLMLVTPEPTAPHPSPLSEEKGEDQEEST
jgi:predicted RND superfamily exporter protein